MPANQPSRKRQRSRYPGVYFRIARNGQRAYEIAFRDERGKQKWERVHGDIDAARDKLADRRRQAAERKHRPERPERTFAQVCDEYMASPDFTDLRPSTRDTYQRALANYARPAFSDRAVGEIDTRAVANWIKDLRSCVRKRGAEKGLRAWTIRGALTALRVVLRYAVGEEYIDHNPVDSLPRHKMPKSDQSEVRVLGDAELRRLFNAAPERSRMALELKAFTGLRSSELRGLVFGDLELEAGRLTVTKQLDHRDNERVEPKTAQARRTVPLPGFLVASLREHKARLGEWGRAGDCDFVFTRDDGRPVTAERFGRDFQTAAKRAGLGPDRALTPHSLRHGYGSMLLAQGRDVIYTSRRMGHANVAITTRIYAHEFEARRTEEDNRTTAALEAAFGEARDADTVNTTVND